jgi:hypothetical protein
MDKESTPFRFWPSLGVVVLLLLALIGVSYYLNQNPDPFTPRAEIGVGGGPNDDSDDAIAQIASDPERYYDMSVTLEGEVESTRGPRMFLIQEEEGLVDDTLLVITRDPLIPSAQRTADNPLLEDDDVTVTGMIREFNVSDIEKEIGFDFDPKIEEEFKNKPIIIADTVQTFEGDKTFR